MKVSEKFIDDMRYLRKRYEWTDTEAAEVRSALQGSAELVHFFTVLAAAHRAGYEQNAGNGFVRLQAWCAGQGLPDPFGPAFNVAALDALAIEPRKRAA